MLLKLQDYKEGEVYNVEHTYNPKELDVEFVDLHYSKPLILEGTVEKGHDVLTFRGQIHSEMELMCGRCLKTLKSDVDKEFELFFETKGLEIVDTTDEIRETLILDHSLAYICSEACKGLCPVCGTNRNEKNCKCETPSGHESLAQLKDIWKKKKEESK